MLLFGSFRPPKAVHLTPYFSKVSSRVQSSKQDGCLDPQELPRVQAEPEHKDPSRSRQGNRGLPGRILVRQVLHRRLEEETVPIGWSQISAVLGQGPGLAGQTKEI